MRVLVLHAANSCRAIRWLCADDHDYRLSPQYVLVTPSINRTLLDSLFTVIYMLEDFPARAEAFHKAGWREESEQYRRYNSTYAGDPKWRLFLKGIRKYLKMGVAEFNITPAEESNLSLIPYWPTPTQMRDALDVQDRPFVRWLDDWFYRETSAMAHLSFYGLTRIGAFLLTDMFTEAQKQNTETESLPKFKAVQVSLTLMILLCFASELERLTKPAFRA